MATVLFYFLILIISTFFVYISDKGKGSLERYTFLFVAFLIVFVPSAIRYDIGTDYLNYLDIYKYLEYENGLEPSFYFINRLLRFLNASPQWLFVISAFIFSIAIFLSYPKKNAWIMHFTAITMLWLFSFNVIRQAIAVAICLVAISKFLDRKYLHFFVLSLFAATFHTSVLIITIVGALALIPIKDSIQNKVLPSIFVFLIIASYLSTNFIVSYIERFLSFSVLSRYLIYIESVYFEEVSGNTSLGLLVLILVCIYVVLNTRSILSFNKQYWLLILLVFGYALSLLLSDHILIFGRLNIVFLVGPIFMTYILFTLREKRKYNALVLIVFLSFITYIFLNTSLGREVGNGNPKLNPYQTIFNEKNNF